MADDHLTADRLREILNYDTETGEFTWAADVRCGHRHGRQVKRRKGDPAGYVNTNGYVMIGIGGKEYRAHRLAWLYVTGDWPESLIDHKNRVKSDNHWSNLRAADKVVNGQNIEKPRSNNSSGYLGVYLHQHSGLWHSLIGVHGRKHSLGYHKTPEEAHAAYIAAKRKLHAGCTI